MRKIAISEDGRFAWAFFGDQLAACVAAHIGRQLKSAVSFDEEGISGTFVEAEERGRQDWTAGGSAAHSKLHGIVLADGHARAIYKSSLVKQGIGIRDDNYLVTGQEKNAAILMVRRFYDPSMTVNDLSVLAAYSIHVAHDLSPACIDGLDIAIYRDSSRKFEFADSAAMEKLAAEVDGRIRKVFSATRESGWMRLWRGAWRRFRNCSGSMPLWPRAELC